jgi:SAM-dependent methyltransferase
MTGLIDQLGMRARRRRFEIFARWLSPLPRPLKILDVGGTMSYWASVDLAALGAVSIVLLNVTPEREPLVSPFCFVLGDACDLSRFADASFDVVFSNSTLAYVADQPRAAAEIMRVGKRCYVQTPNRYFPLDWRTLAPFFHLLPATWQAWAFRHFCVGIYPREPDRQKAVYLATRVRDVSRAELRRMFPRGTLRAERICGLAKSWTVFGYPKH